MSLPRILDLLLPANGELPGAGALGLAVQVQEVALAGPPRAAELDPDVPARPAQAATGYPARPPQPHGHPLEPFDERVLATVRARTPHYRRA